MSKGLHRAALLATLLLPSAGWAHAGHTDRQPWDVCAGQSLGSNCSWIAGDHTLRAGSCREIGGALMCVRTKPIVPAAAAEVANPSARVWPWVAGGAMLLFAGATWVRAKQRRNTTRAQG